MKNRRHWEQSFLMPKVIAYLDCVCKTFAHTGSQTEDEDILFCQECDYPADNLYSLGEHVGEFHSEKVAEDMDATFVSSSFLLRTL